jgi:outer membrane protein
MKKSLILLLLIGFVSGWAQTSESKSYSFTLKQAIDFALQNQNDVKNAELDQQIARSKVKEITGMGLPQINSSFDTKYFAYIPTSIIPNFVSPAVYGGLVQAGVAPYDPEKLSPDGYAPIEAQFGTKYQATAGIDASQLIFSGDYFLGLKASKTFVDISTKALYRTRIETTVTVSKAYYNVLINNERMKLMDANIARLKKTMEDTKVLYENGFVEKLDYDRLQVLYNNLQMEKEKIERLLSVGNYLLKYQMGMDINTPLELTDKIEEMGIDASNLLNATQKFDYTKRVEFNLFETQQKLAKLDLKRQRLSYLPNAFAYGSMSGSALRNTYSVFRMDYGWFPTSLVGATVKLPIFTGGQRYYKNQQAKLALQKAENNMEFIKRSIDLDLASTSVMLANATKSLDNQKKNIVLAEAVVNVSKKKMEQGVGSNLELITAETALKEAQTNYINALYDAIVAKIDFDKANGNIK